MAIHCYGALHGPTVWQPGNQDALSHCIKTCLYVADTSDPVIISLPSSKNLKVVTMNCAVETVGSPSPTQQCTNPATVPPTTVPLLQVVQIQSQSSLPMTLFVSFQTALKV